MKTLPIFCLDIETTGLDVLKCEPIEVALLQVIEEGDRLIAGESFSQTLPAPPLEEWEPEALAMAERSGLLCLVGAHHSLARLEGDSPLAAAAAAAGATFRRKHRAAVEAAAIEWLQRFGEGPFVACGNNVGGFDLTVLRRTMPGLAAQFYYRCLDVSALKLAFGRLGWGAVPEKSNSHRALADCRETLRELSCYHAQAIDSLVSRAENGAHAARIWRKAGLEAKVVED